jgi:hypothetical protein
MSKFLLRKVELLDLTLQLSSFLAHWKIAATEGDHLKVVRVSTVYGLSPQWGWSSLHLLALAVTLFSPNALKRQFA